MSQHTAATAFALAAVLHAGFQMTVSAIVYPALVEVDPERWTSAHDRHSRRIVGVVAVVYGLLVVAGVALVVAGPSVLGWSALVATLGAVVATAAWAAPTHGRLAVPDPALLQRLLVADRVRCGFAVLAAALASVAVLGG